MTPREAQRRRALKKWAGHVVATFWQALQISDEADYGSQDFNFAFSFHKMEVLVQNFTFLVDNFST